MDIHTLECIINDIRNIKIDSYTTQLLTAKERAILHTAVEQYHDITTTSIAVEGSKNKKIVISKKLHEKQPEITTTLTPELIDLFIKFSRMPIPINSVEHVDYYISHLSKYYDENLYPLFLNEVKLKQPYGVAHKFKTEIYDTMKKINEFINNNDEFIRFKRERTILPSVDKKDVYIPENNGKTFISIDVRSANFRTLKHYCPSICKPTDEWVDFIAQFTSNTFIQNSKQFREVVFGELGCQRLLTLPVLFITEVDEHIRKSKYVDFLIRRCLKNDEMMYEMNYARIDEFNITEFEAFVEAIRSGYFRVDFYTLRQLGEHLMFIKEFKNGKRVFKKVQKRFVMQAIKFYESQPIIDLDRKFTDLDSGMTATFDNNLF